MNLLIKEIPSNNGLRAIHKVYNRDTGEEITKLTEINLNISCNNWPELTIKTFGELEFEGQCNLKIIKENKNDK